MCADVVAGLLGQTVGLVRTGDMYAERLLAELRELPAGRLPPTASSVVRDIDGMLDIRAGRFDGALSGAVLVAARWYQGRLAELLPVLRSAPRRGCRLAALAVAAAAAGDRPAATAAVDRLAGEALGAATRSEDRLVRLFGLVEAAHVLGDADVSARAYAALLPIAALPVMCEDAGLCLGSAHHPLGVACLTMGDVDTAVVHFRTATRANLARGIGRRRCSPGPARPRLSPGADRAATPSWRRTSWPRRPTWPARSGYRCPGGNDFGGTATALSARRRSSGARGTGGGCGSGHEAPWSTTAWAWPIWRPWRPTRAGKFRPSPWPPVWSRPTGPTGIPRPRGRLGWPIWSASSGFRNRSRSPAARSWPASPWARRSAGRFAASRSRTPGSATGWERRSGPGACAVICPTDQAVGTSKAVPCGR